MRENNLIFNCFFGMSNSRELYDQRSEQIFVYSLLILETFNCLFHSYEIITRELLNNIKRKLINYERSINLLVVINKCIILLIIMQTHYFVNNR